MANTASETILQEVVTIIGGQVTLIRVAGDGQRQVWIYDRGEAGGLLLPDSSRRHKLMIECGTAPVWESSDLQAQARQIAKIGWGRAIIDEADVEAWAVGAQVRAARNEADDLYDFLSTAGADEAQEWAERDEDGADAELAQ